MSGGLSESSFNSPSFPKMNAYFCICTKYTNSSLVACRIVSVLRVSWTWYGWERAWHWTSANISSETDAGTARLSTTRKPSDEYSRSVSTRESARVLSFHGMYEGCVMCMYEVSSLCPSHFKAGGGMGRGQGVFISL